MRRRLLIGLVEYKKREEERFCHCRALYLRVVIRFSRHPLLAWDHHCIHGEQGVGDARNTPNPNPNPFPFVYPSSAFFSLH